MRYGHHGSSRNTRTVCSMYIPSTCTICTWLCNTLLLPVVFCLEIKLRNNWEVGLCSGGEGSMGEAERLEFFEFHLFIS